MKKNTINFTLKFTLMSSLIVLTSGLLTGLLGWIFFSLGMFTMERIGGPIMLLIWVSSNFIIGSILSVTVLKKSTNYYNSLLTALRRIGDGDFDIELKNNHKAPFLKQLTDNINKMASDLKGLEIMRVNFINDFSHDFKTPISAILGYVKRLKKSDLTPNQKNEYIEIIIEEATRLQNLATNTLQMSKLENTFINIEKALFSLDELIRNVLIVLEKNWSNKNITINFKLEDTKFYGNEELLKQVFINLIENSIKFSHSNSIIDINLFRVTNSIIFTIKDYGIGISEENTSKIFDKYYQVDSSRITTGNGLGLSIVKKIVNLHNGKIEVESILNEETKFTIFLPV